jgi:hypothetical protein
VSEPDARVGRCLQCMDDTQYIILSTADACDRFSDRDSIDNNPVGGE